jgi:putative acetyltransferase
MDIRIDNLTGKEIYDLLSEHLEDMHLTSPPESVHALDIEGLRKPGITFWTIWQDDKLAGCGALKELTSSAAEIKSMRTAHGFRRQGVGAKLLNHILTEARQRNYQTLYLETGSMDYFAPARKLYESFGFKACGPFAGYTEDPNSIFMIKALMFKKP